jgi:hypothetical protein
MLIIDFVGDGSMFGHHLSGFLVQRFCPNNMAPL